MSTASGHCSRKFPLSLVSSGFLYILSYPHWCANILLKKKRKPSSSCIILCFVAESRSSQRWSLLAVFISLPFFLLLSHSVVSVSLWTHRLLPTRLFCPWNFPGKNTGVGCHFLLQGIFPIQGLNWYLLGLLHWQADSLLLRHWGSHSFLNPLQNLPCCQMSSTLLNPVVSSVFFLDLSSSISNSQVMGHFLPETRSPGFRGSTPTPLACISGPFAVSSPLGSICSHYLDLIQSWGSLNTTGMLLNLPLCLQFGEFWKKCPYPCNHHYSKTREFFPFSKKLVPHVSVSQLIPTTTLSPGQPHVCFVNIH